MHRLVLRGLVVASVLILASCGGDDGGGTAGEEDGGGAPTTYAGETRLALGEEAEIEGDDGSGEPEVYTIAVTAIEQSTPEALTAEGVEVDDPTQVPYFVRFTVEKVSDGPTTSFTGTGFTGITADDSPSGPLTIIGEFAPCQATALADDAPAGTTAEQCTVFLVDEGAELVGVRKSPTSGPVSWVAS